MRNPRAWTAVLTASGVYGAFVAVFGLWGVPYMVQVRGLSRVHASNLVALGAVGRLLSAPFVGGLSDRVLRVRKPPLVSATALDAAGWAGLALPAPPIPAVRLGPLCFFLGAGSGSVALVFACLREVNVPATWEWRSASTTSPSSWASSSCSGSRG